MQRNRRALGSQQTRGKNDISQLGIFGVPNVGGLEDEEDDDDPELEAELMSILGSGGGPNPRVSDSKKAKAMPQANLDQMIAASMRDVSSDESSGEEDPSLLAELQEFIGEKVQDAAPPSPATPESSGLVTILTERLAMYKDAELNAKTAGDTAKARRLGRGLATLEELLRKARRGGVVEESEIPLPVALKSQPPSALPSGPKASGEEGPEPGPPPPIPPRRSIPREPTLEEKPQVDEEVLLALQTRRDEYKRAAVAAKKAGDLETAKAHIRVIKQFEGVISSVEEGQKVNLDSMPPAPLPIARPPPTVIEPPPPEPAPEPSPLQQSSEMPMPATVLEALEQRLAVFRKQEETAKTEGNSSKARRMGRIAKQYEDSIKLHNAGKEIPVDELPTPPGFPPIPVEKKAPSIAAEPEPGLLSPGSQQPLPPQRSASPSPTPSISTTASVSPKPTARMTRQEKQLAILLKKQSEWKDAAIAAKKAGDIPKAKECLRQAKGFDPLIEATHSGLPVDLATIPVPPKDKMENDFEVVNIRDCLPGTNAEIYEQLKHDLKNQFKMSMETRLHYKSLGDVGNANKFEQLAVHTKKDLDRVMVLQERDDPIPRYHYEMRTFAILRSNTDLNDNDLELSIIQGVNYNVPNPKEIDTYVRYEFPFPAEDGWKDKTATVYNTNNPQYNNVAIIPIMRNNRACQRVFKRHSIKLEVWSKGGFLRSDSLVGTVSVKLQPLETKCSIHDSYNLMDGRKAVGGKLEIKIRIRHPIQENEIEQVKEKWLLID